MFMLILTRPNGKKKPSNTGGKKLVNWEENHYIQVARIMDYRPRK